MQPSTTVKRGLPMGLDLDDDDDDDEYQDPRAGSSPSHEIVGEHNISSEHKPEHDVNEDGDAEC